MKLVKIALVACLSIGFSTRANAESCKAYTIETPGRGYGYEEINNCPIEGGKFSNSNWQVRIGHWEPATYFYIGKNLRNGSSISLSGFDVTGTTDRPQYRFKNKNVTYAITFQRSDPNTIKLEVFQGNRRILNQFLHKSGPFHSE
jgi:hypothetical protein